MLRRMNRHRLRPLFKGRVTNQGGDWHARPHRAPVYIRLSCVISLAARKDKLEAETPIRDRGYRYRHSMEKLSMIIGMVMRVLTTYPALEVGYVALQEWHYADLPNRLPLVAAPAPRTVPPFL